MLGGESSVGTCQNREKMNHMIIQLQNLHSAGLKLIFTLYIIRPPGKESDIGDSLSNLSYIFLCFLPTKMG